VIDEDGTTLVTYVYNAWGEIVSQTYANGGASTAVVYNPFCYRGYYYDSETGLYYVSSRYYDPEIGRWINADIPETLTADFENFAQYNLFAYCFNNPVNLSDETGTWPSWATKLAIGIGAIVIGAAVVAATAATGGAAAAFVGAAVAGLKAAAVSGAIGAAVGAGTSAVSHRVSTGSWSGAGKVAIDGAVDGFASGFMTGGIMAGGSQILSSGFKVAANAGVPTGRNGGLTIGNKLRVLSPNHPQAYEAGGTLLKIGSKYKNIRFDVGSNSLFHMNIQLAKTANYHLPIGMLGSGLWGGIARD
jgi:RHS repeat-associated protein